MRRIWLSAWVFSVALMAGPRPACAETVQPPVSVELLSEIEAQRPEIRLGDIARIEAARLEYRRELEQLSICFAPMPGDVREVSREYILLKLRQHGIDTAPIVFDGAGTARVVAVGSRIEADTIVAAITRALEKAMPWDPEEVVISPPRTVADVDVPVRDPRLEVVVDPDDEFLGSTLVRVRVLAGARELDTIAYRFDLAVHRDVFIAKDFLPRGTILGPEHVVTERMDIAPLHGRYVTAGEAIFGLRLMRSVRRGTRLGPRMLEEPPVVERGDFVRVSVTGEGFAISTGGKAKEPGAMGSVIRVELPSSRPIYARVTGPGTVTLEE